ncbi:hypothetical protein QA612_21455 [Evansella sp. AB-P1]|nr:hypothetical protein [Evansella sp. AB-P1]MDG5790027.1 hypothetical protein [Evansella sp. AB-P1]
MESYETPEEERARRDTAGSGTIEEAWQVVRGKRSGMQRMINLTFI